MALLQRGRFQEQRGFLPPLSIATIIGVLLFGAYIGSAVLSALPFGRRKVEGFKGVGALYTSSDEAAYCAMEQPEWDSCFAPSQPTNRTIYMQP